MAKPTGDVNIDWISCSRKVMYRSRKYAKDAATKLGRRDHKLYRPYACGICGGYHLTSKPKG